MSELYELTLLYVEDDHDLREQFVRVLRPKFKQVYEAVDGLQALEKYEQYKPNMIVVDINMPKMNGLEVIENIRKHDKDTPIVILSAYSDQDKLLRAMTLGLSKYLIKPVPHKELLSLLEEMALKYEDKAEERDMIAFQNGYFWKKEEKILCHLDEIIPLTKREIILLEHLVENTNKIIPFSAIEALIWQDSDLEDRRHSLSHLLKRLRKKLPEELIENIYGEGYRIISL